MIRVYEFDAAKKADVMKVLEADPYAEDSFARAGFKVKDGVSVGADNDKAYIYISASDDFMKKADARLKDLAKHAPADVEKRVSQKIQEEEDTVAAGVSMFGE